MSSLRNNRARSVLSAIRRGEGIGLGTRNTEIGEPTMIFYRPRRGRRTPVFPAESLSKSRQFYTPLIWPPATRILQPGFQKTFGTTRCSLLPILYSFRHRVVPLEANFGGTTCSENRYKASTEMKSPFGFRSSNRLTNSIDQKVYFFSFDVGKRLSKFSIL